MRRVRLKQLLKGGREASACARDSSWRSSLVRYSRVGFGILRLINMQGVRLTAKSLNKVNYFAFESILHEWMRIVNSNYTLADLFCYVVRETLGFLVEP